MTDLARRTALYGIATGNVAALAGCTVAGDPAPGGGGSDDSGDGSDAGVDDEPTFVARQAGTTLSEPVWDRTERRGFCTLLTEEDDDRSWLLDEAFESVREFVEETDFAESVICYVESVGPNTCYDEIAFDPIGLGVEDGTLVGDATVVGPGDGDVDCGQAITFPSALLRVTSEPLPDAARLTVTDGWGETGTIRSGDGALDPD